MPQPSLNGTSLGVLIMDRQSTYDALRAAIRMLERMEPHPRDYQLVQDTKAAYELALKQHQRRWTALVAMEKSLQEELEFLFDERDRRQAKGR
jgi:hypothetical protein